MPTKNFNKTEIINEFSVCALATAVNDWMEYLGVASNVITNDRGKLGHELKVTTEGISKPHDLTHVGVGASQVLPILVMCLITNPDTTVIIEQPELHLHPKVQSNLADFFISISQLNKQLIIETHSEHIINRLRYRAVSAKPENAIHDKINIFFVSRDKDSSNFKPVNINEYGAILDWPEGFFDQSQHEAEDILKAAIEKNRKERNLRNAQ